MRHEATNAEIAYHPGVSFVSRFAGALKPEYLYQPRFLLRRLRNSSRHNSGVTRYVIPGGGAIEAVAEEEHGRILDTLGVVDLPVTEALWRLAAPGEICADVGANIGYMTGIFAGRIRRGTIYAFEALPTVFEELQRNVAMLGTRFPDVQIHAESVAVSSKSGHLSMEMPTGFNTNRGLAKVGESGGLEVAAITLDDAFGERSQIGVMKLDVEGHELAVLQGAEGLFRTRRVRDCVFEEHRAFPTDVTTWFETHGYTVLRIARRLVGPKLIDPRLPYERVSWLPVSLLATADAKRARQRFAPLGWSSLAAKSLP